MVSGNCAAGPHMLPNAHILRILCTRPALPILFLTSLETTRTRTRLEHKAQDSTRPALLRLQQQELEGARRCCVLFSSGGPDSLRCVFASHKSNEVSPLREPHRAAAQKFDRSRLSEAPSCLEDCIYDKSSRTHLVRRRNEYY